MKDQKNPDPDPELDPVPDPLSQDTDSRIGILFKTTYGSGKLVLS
jgi:hypothetical protein